MIKTKEHALIQLKFGLSFKKLLDKNKVKKSDNKSNGINDHKLIYSLGKLSSATGLRKATLSNIFSGNANPEGTTIILILEGLNKSFSDFANAFESITEEELNLYYEDIATAKKNRKMKKASKL